jgi:hypothetical protein
MRIITMTAFLLLTACSTHMPVGCPKPNIPPEPHYPVQDLRPGDSRDKVAKAYVATVRGQHDYIHGQLLPIMRACQ